MGQVTPIPLAFPDRGVVTTGRRSEQPPGTCVDMLNMRIFDAAERATGAQRTGTSKLWAAALGSGVQPIQLLEQTTIALDPSTIAASTQLLNEPFTYADGNLETVATAAVWKSYDGAGVHDVTKYTITGNKLKSFVAATGGFCVYQPNLVLGSAFILKMDVTPIAVGVSCQASIGCRQDKTTPLSSHGIWLSFAANASGAMTLNLGVNFNSNSLATFTSPNGFILNATAYTLELRVNGDGFQGFVNGILYVSGTSSADNTLSGISIGAGVSTGNQITTDNLQVFVGTNLSSYRQNNIVSVCGGNIYLGDIATQATLVTGGASQVRDSGIPQGAFGDALYYIVDGFNIKKLQVVTRLMVTYTATAGTAPINCTLACFWRDRLVLAAPRDTPQNVFFSRIGTATDWDYSQTDSAAAFAGNQSAAGRIGQPIVALIPMSDDVLGVGGDHNFWAIRGDPASGGSVDVVSDAIGILGARAWCTDPTGVVWFVGTGGIFKWVNGQGAPVCVSNDKVNNFFKSVNRGTNYVLCVWDRDRWALRVFITPVNTGPTTHIVYDVRKDAFMPEAYPDNHGPVSALVYDGDGPTDRALLMGGRVGIIQKIDEAAKSDDGVAINSYVIIGPANPGGPNGRARVLSLDLMFTEAPAGYVDADFNCIVSMLSDDDISKAWNSAAARYTRSKTFSKWGRQTRWIWRQVGCYFYFKLANSTLNKTFAFNIGQARMEEAGRTRSL